MSIFIETMKSLKSKGKITNETIDKLNCLNSEQKEEIKAIGPNTENDYKTAYEILSQGESEEQQ